jgi:predicted Holliday junction resolvase-like endonuclease
VDAQLIVVCVLLVAAVMWLAQRWRAEAARHAELRASLPQIERRARDHALRTRDGVRLGQVAEQLAPFLDAFAYDPRDAHFIGRPIDFVIFDGLAEGEVREVVFLEVKTGKRRSLDERQESARRCIARAAVRFETLTL